MSNRALMDAWWSHVKQCDALSAHTPTLRFGRADLSRCARTLPPAAAQHKGATGESAA
jgi:hypothetical protein